MKTQQRLCRIALPAKLDTALRDALIRELQTLDIEINYLPENNIVGIRYSFPEVSFNTIWHLIKTHIDSKRFGFLSRTRFELRASMEQTEAQYQHARYGWNIYVRDIMVASHLRDEARRSNRVAKPWQTVKRPENPNS